MIAGNLRIGAGGETRGATNAAGHDAARYSLSGHAEKVRAAPGRHAAPTTGGTRGETGHRRAAHSFTC